MTTRRALTPSELTFARICFERISPDLLAPASRALFESLASQFAFDSRLSDAQLAILKRLKLTSDKGKRSDAIARGRIPFDDETCTDSKLNTIYNPVRPRN